MTLRARSTCSLFTIALISTACGGEDSKPAELHVDLVSYSPDQLLSGDDTRDDLALVVHYDDADADLGSGKAEVQDCRGAALLTVLDLPAIASDAAIAAGAPIRGELTLHVDDIGALSASTELPELCASGEADKPQRGEAVFCLRLVDTAGHVSNVVCTGAVAVK